MRRGDDILLPSVALAALVPAILLSAIELSATGALGPAVIALDSIAVMLLPFGLLSLLFTLGDRSGGISPSDDGSDNDGGGGDWDFPAPNLPSGGLEIDWDRFEAELRAWSEARQVPA